MTPWTVDSQAPLYMEFSRQEYWSGLPFSSPRDLPNLGIEPGSPALQADALPSEPPGSPGDKAIAKQEAESYEKCKLQAPEFPPLYFWFGMVSGFWWLHKACALT